MAQTVLVSIAPCVRTPSRDIATLCVDRESMHTSGVSLRAATKVGFVFIVGAVTMPELAWSPFPNVIRRLTTPMGESMELDRRPQF